MATTEQIINYITECLMQLNKFYEEKIKNPNKNMIDYYLPENTKDNIIFCHECVLLKLLSIKNLLMCGECEYDITMEHIKDIYEGFFDIYADECEKFNRFCHTLQQLLTSSGEIQNKLRESFSNQFAEMENREIKFDKDMQITFEKTIKVIKMLTRENLDIYNEELKKADEKLQKMTKEERKKTCLAKEASFVLINSGISKEIVDEFVINAMIIDTYITEQRECDAVTYEQEKKQEYENIRENYEKLVKFKQETVKQYEEFKRLNR